jgi:hypothetical protein
VSAGLDHRSLAAFRIAFGATLLANLWIRVKDGRLEAHYSALGVLPPESIHHAATRWSFLDALGSISEVQVGFAVIAAIYLAYTLGLFTRAMQVLVVLCLVSLYHRNPLIDDGSDWTMRFWAIWTALLPLGRRYSLDVRWRRVKAAGGSYESFALWAFVVNLAISYYLNAYQKDGATWRDLTAVGLVVWDPYLSTGLAEAARANMTPLVTQAATALPRFVEYLLAFSLLFSLRSDPAKRTAGVLIAGLHLGFILFLNLGTFGYMYLAGALLFIPGADWDRITTRRAPRRRSRSHPLLLAVVSLWCAFVLFELSTKNPRIPKSVATVGWSFRSWFDPMHELLMVPQEWFMFRAPGRNHGYIVIETFGRGGHRDFLRPGPFDVTRPGRKAVGVGKYWTSYLHRLASPAMNGFRDELAAYLERQGVDRFVVHKVALLLPEGAAKEPSAITPSVLFSHRAPQRVDFDLRNIVRAPGLRPQATRQFLHGGDWRGRQHLILRFSVDSAIELSFQAPGACTANVVLGYTRGPSFGIVDIEWNDERAATIDAYDSIGLNRAETQLHRLSILEGENRITIVSRGNNPRAMGLDFAVDDLAILCD